MTDLNSLLDRADRAVSLVPLPTGGLETLRRRRDRKRRNQRLVAGFVGIAVFVAAVWIVSTGGPFDRSRTPTATGPTVPPTPGQVGYIGLPPEGTAPSTPERGELVLSLTGRSTADRGLLTRIYVYADGRVIWAKQLSENAIELTTGFLEQRLTPEGVEHVRSEIVATGLLGNDLVLLSDSSVIGGTVEVRDGDRLVRLTWSSTDLYEGDRGTVATPEQASALERFDELLTQPTSWLPADAWEDPEIRAYVPSSYAVCYTMRDRTVEPSRILTLLPAPAEDLLRARDRTRYGDPIHGDIYCTAVTTEEARALAGTFEDAGLAQDPDEIELRLAYLVDPPGLPIGRSPVRIYFEPYLPHGEFLPCSLCP